MKEHRADVTLRLTEFLDVETAGAVVVESLAQYPAVDALFVAWDEPAIRVVRVLHAIGRDIPIITIDLGNEAATEIARGGLIKGVGAQMPYDLGLAEATAVITALVGAETPAWVAFPAFPVTRDNVLEGYEAVWHCPPPPTLLRAFESAGEVP
jgi:ribose transport system substrate-binding protein